jgi:hypothetical protein
MCCRGNNRLIFRAYHGGDDVDYNLDLEFEGETTSTVLSRSRELSILLPPMAACDPRTLFAGTPGHAA